ncbi:Hsp70 family protein [Dactylosporangium sp. NPDC000555]|uniref:Hsp70 family protein n=1 Tax=Dactylosporangium sp. NPDC000555 TaxID=3154260 RepID=UPI00331E7650
MSNGVNARLGIDVGASRVKAVLAWPDGTVEPLTFNGVPWVDVVSGIDGSQSGLDRGDGQPGAAAFPLRVLAGRALDDGGPPLDVVEGVAAPLRVVVQEATRVAGGLPELVTVVVSAAWGPQRRTALRGVLHRAGLGQPSLVEAPVAVAWHLVSGGVDVAEGSCLLVCDFGTGFEASVLRRKGMSFEVLAAVESWEAGGAALDTALAQHLAAAAAEAGAEPSPALPISQARTAKEGLSTARSVLVGLGGGAPAMVLGVDRLREVSGPATDAAVDAVRRTLAGAEVPAEQLAWVVCVGGGARLPVVAKPLADALGVQPLMVAEADLAAVYGAVQAAASEPGSAVVPAGRSWVRLADSAGVVLPALLSVGLFAQFMAGTQRYGPRQSITPGMVLAHWGGLAVASVMAVLAAAAGVLLSTATRHDSAAGGRLVHRLLGAALGAGAVGGLVVAAVYATIAASYFDMPAGGFLRWSVLAVVPVVVAMVVLAGVMVWRPDPPGGSWFAWVRFPVSSVLLVGVGEMLIGYDVSGAPQLLRPLGWQLDQWFPTSGMQVISAIGRIGAACVGAGIGLLLVRRVWHRTLAAVPLAALAAATVALRTTGLIAAGFVIAAAGWWLWQALYVVLYPVFLGRTSTYAGGPADSQETPAVSGVGRTGSA